MACLGDELRTFFANPRQRMSANVTKSEIFGLLIEVQLRRGELGLKPKTWNRSWNHYGTECARTAEKTVDHQISKYIEKQRRDNVCLGS